MKIYSTNNFAKFFDHTNLKPNATTTDITKLVQEAKTVGAATVCVNSCWIPLVTELLQGSDVLPIAVVGFPLGTMATPAKVFETKWAVDAGAREIDMVINIGQMLGGQIEAVASDIEAVIDAAGPTVPVKVIIETAYLNHEQIALVTRWCATLGAAFVKTSTGFAPRGATTDDIRLIAATLADTAGRDLPQIKASGGIRTLADAVHMIEAGAHRIGASATVSIVEDYRRSLDRAPVLDPESTT